MTSRTRHVTHIYADVPARGLSLLLQVSIKGRDSGTRGWSHDRYAWDVPLSLIVPLE
jgi:hypothetical protein